MVWYFDGTFYDRCVNKKLQSASFNYTKKHKLCSSCRFEGTSLKEVSSEGVGAARLPRGGGGGGAGGGGGGGGGQAERQRAQK
jgi:uncharacterized membrane protein